MGLRCLQFFNEKPTIINPSNEIFKFSKIIALLEQLEMIHFPLLGPATFVTPEIAHQTGQRKRFSNICLHLY